MTAPRLARGLVAVALPWGRRAAGGGRVRLRSPALSVSPVLGVPGVVSALDGVTLNLAAGWQDKLLSVSALGRPRVHGERQLQPLDSCGHCWERT